MKLDINHSAITVSDMDRSVQFYRDVLGMELLMLDQEEAGPVGKAVGEPAALIKFANLRLEGGEIELIQFVRPRGEQLGGNANDVGKMHLCFRVDDIQAAYDELRAKGVRFWTPVNVIKEGPAKDWKFVYFSDPDGVQLELLEIP
jgi:catechol 2,3-dioxygenase-like lactoylglutathione lyase family enzyme